MFGKFSVRKPYTVLVAVVLVIVLGIVSFTKMTSDLLPNISFPYVLVMTTYPGASPETVEMVVTKPVESSMATVSNIEEISSVSNENYSMVILQFAQSADMNAVSLEIRENLDQIRSYWDDSVGNPIIMKINPDMLPVMIAAVGGKDMSAAEITDLTNDTIVPELESIEGVASVSGMGLLEESVNVIIRQEKIDAVNEQVFGSIDKEIDENLAELQENKQDIYDGQAELENAKKCADANKGYAVFNESGKQVYPKADFSPYLVEVTATDLNIRKGPGTNYGKTGKFTGKGVFTITEERAGTGSNKGWGKLKSGAGWISLDYVKRL